MSEIDLIKWVVSLAKAGYDSPMLALVVWLLYTVYTRPKRRQERQEDIAKGAEMALSRWEERKVQNAIGQSPKEERQATQEPERKDYLA